MLIYEVNLSVSAEIAAEYAQFLEKHMDDVVRVGGFLRAEWWQRQPSDEAMVDAGDQTLWTIHYHVDSREKLDRYLIEHAATMRAEALERFGKRFTTTRRILFAPSRAVCR
jgi:hypothetical protein